MTEQVLAELRRWGVLLLADQRLPSVTTLVAGEPVQGSWWGHAKGHEIFAVSEALEDHQDVLLCKLIAGKVTFVHRDRWGDLFAVGIEDAPWKRNQLSAADKWLLDRVQQASSLRIDQLDLPKGRTRKDVQAAARVLEGRLLIHATNVHTDKGAHAKLLQTWEECANRLDYKEKLPAVAVARGRFEELAREWGTRLPWAATQQ